MSNKEGRKKLLKMQCPSLLCCARLWSLSYVSASDQKVRISLIVIVIFLFILKMNSRKYKKKL